MKHQKNIVAYGCAGTGKTFVTLYKALSDVLMRVNHMKKYI